MWREVPTNQNNSQPKELLPAGSYSARCVSIIDIGTQYNEKYNKFQRCIRFTFELPTETVVYEESKWEEPRLIGKEFTLSFAEKAWLRKNLIQWLGKDPIAKWQENSGTFDISLLLWLPCTLSIGVIEVTKGEINVVNGISALTKGVKLEKQHNPLTMLNLYEFDPEIYKAQPKFIQDKIVKSTEWETVRDLVI